MEPKISFCLITKNEDKFLGKCLDSIKAVADEIIILDTGSTDQTKEIAAEYTDKIFDYTWENDFSKARNASINKATNPWIFIIDADEVLTTISREKLKPFLEKITFDDKPKAFQVKVNDLETNMRLNLMIKGVLFQKHPDLEFTRPVHEFLTYKKGSLTIEDSPIELHHLGKYNRTLEELTIKNNFYVEHLKQLINKTSNEKEKAYYNYHIGLSYDSINQKTEAKEHFNLAKEAYDKSPETKYSHLYSNIMIALFQTIRFLEPNSPDLENLLKELLSYIPDHQEALFYLAYWEQSRKNYDDAIHYYEQAIAAFR